MGRRGRELRYRYGLTTDQFDALLAEQHGVCAICGTGEPQAPAFMVDHSHRCCPGRKSCGKCVRGLLCRSCNLILGYANDDTEVLASAIRYLDRHSRRFFSST